MSAYGIPMSWPRSSTYIVLLRRNCYDADVRQVPNRLCNTAVTDCSMCRTESGRCSSQTLLRLGFRHDLQCYLNSYRLLPLVADSKNSIATGPRDKIYAIVGLAKELYDGQLGDFGPNTLLLMCCSSTFIFFVHLLSVGQVVRSAVGKSPTCLNLPIAREMDSSQHLD